MLSIVAEWVTYKRAAEIAGCSLAAIGYAVRRGQIVSRHAGRTMPAL